MKWLNQRTPLPTIQSKTHPRVSYNNDAQATGDLHPIAVLNVNYDDRGDSPNLNLAPVDEVDDLFTRRFFFFDVVSG